ncbi:MAG: cytochrome c biogenesis heme-transporting ATPase CcmA [Saccharospirillum sp.]
MAAVLTTEQLSCERDHRLLFRGLSFEVAPGDIVHIKGPNGAGKTTLLRALVGLTTVVEGRIHWFPEQLAEGEQPSEKIWYIAHRPAVTLLQSPLENVRYSLTLHGLELPEEALWQALKAVGLLGYEDVPSHQLSAGQQRRVGLARLFLPVERNVGVWVLDEPLTALDIEAVEHLKRRILGFARGGGSVIMTSHHGIDSGAVRSLDLEAFQ